MSNKTSLVLSGTTVADRKSVRSLVRNKVANFSDRYVRWLSDLTETEYTKRQALWFSLFPVFLALAILTAEWVPVAVLNVIMSVLSYIHSL